MVDLGNNTMAALGVAGALDKVNMDDDKERTHFTISNAVKTRTRCL